jgi:hypothetical protein
MPYLLFIYSFLPLFCAGPDATNRTGRQEHVGKKRKKGMMNIEQGMSNDEG